MSASDSTISVRLLSANSFFTAASSSRMMACIRARDESISK